MSPGVSWEEELPEFDIPENMRGKKANLHQVLTHNIRRIRISEDEWPWIAENHERGEGLFGKVARKVKRKKLYVEFNPLSKKSYFMIRDSHSKVFDYIEENTQRYYEVKWGGIKERNDRLRINWTEEDMEFIEEFDNTVLPFQYAFVAEMLKKAHSNILTTFYDRLAFVRRIAIKESMDYPRWNVFLQRLERLMLPDPTQVYALSNLAKDPMTQRRVEEISEKLKTIEEPTMVQATFEMLLLDEIGKKRMKDEDVRLLKTMQQIFGRTR